MNGLMMERIVTKSGKFARHARRWGGMSLLAGLLAAGTPLSIARAAESSVASADVAGTRGAAADDIDPARLETARAVVGKLFPVGTYRKMMGRNLSRLMDGMVNQMAHMPAVRLAGIAGVSEERIRSIDSASLDEASRMLDPNFTERTKRETNAMLSAMADLMDGFEPRVREALSRAYARHFSAAQLAELNRFFATPTGSAYAAQSMLIAMDPEILRAMQDLMPDLMKKMPELTGDALKAGEDLPPPRKIKDMSQDEREKLARLLGVSAKDLRDAPAADDAADKGGK